MDPVLLSRWLTFVTLGFHILYATIGVGLPLMIVLYQWLGIKTGDDDYRLMARRVTRGFTVSVAVGVVTGTAIGIQLSLLWPRFMALAGEVIALPLFLETFAFFVEAIFLGAYVYAWGRYKSPRLNLMLLIPVAIGGAFSAFFITSVNAFMNTPQGFVLTPEGLSNIRPLVAMFNPATPTKVSHVLSSAYMTAAFLLVSISAWGYRRASSEAIRSYYWKALKVALVSGLVFSLATALIGDFSGKFLAVYQPEKLAAAEWLFQTEEKAPLLLFGWLGEGERIVGALSFPFALSFLAHGTLTAKVTGLDQFDRDVWPPLIIHYFFDVMVLIGVFLIILALWILWVMHRQEKQTIHPAVERQGGEGALKKWHTNLLTLSGPLAFLAIEFGWIFAEMGRQPWILRGFMRTHEAATTSSDVAWLIILFVLLYTFLGIGTLVILKRIARRPTLSEERLRMRS